MDPGELEHYNRQQRIMLQNISAMWMTGLCGPMAQMAQGRRRAFARRKSPLIWWTVVHHLKFVRGCSGNTKGVAYLAEGMAARDVADRLRGIPCQGANSCPHQLSLAIEQALREAEKN